MTLDRPIPVPEHVQEDVDPRAALGHDRSGLARALRDLVDDAIRAGQRFVRRIGIA